MNKRKIRIGILISCIFLLLIVLWQFFNTSEPIDFSRDIKPILNKNCISCHGGVQKNAGFSLLFEDEALGNTKAGRPAIIPGNAAGSELIKRINAYDPEYRMPYKKSKLSDKDIDLLTRWIDEGAKWGDHWAYALPTKVDYPKDFKENNTFVKNGIDAFIFAKLEREKLLPNAPASTNILARRVAFDLVGLPPSQDDIAKMNSDPKFYEEYVDHLLEQNSFGEKWASWWLDMARYADSKGYEKDNGRTMWEYRDWVIKAFNKDMPYDQFTIEQLAGDLLLNPTIDQLIATAFHRNTMNNDEGGTDDEEFRVASVIDRVNTTFDVWQSTTIGCVQCHSHPYDPFLHRDYYELMAFFNNSRDEDIPSESPVLKFYNTEQQEKFDNVITWLNKYGNEALTSSYKNFMLFNEPVYNAHLMIDFVNGVYDNHAAVELWDNGSCKLENVWTSGGTYMYINYLSNINDSKMIVRKNNAQGEILASFDINKTKGRVTQKIPFKKLNEKIDLYFETSNNNIDEKSATCYIYWLSFLEDIPGEKEANHPSIVQNFTDLLETKTPGLAIMSENPDYMKRATQIFERGNWLLKGDTVQVGTPKILNDWKSDWPKNRLGLSKWLVDKKNPLTARTLVNRVWHQIYGRGLVATVEDIGSQSDAPSHPALLDWLALRLMNEHQWSIKSLIKEIVLSGTYRQNSETTPENYQKDPHNELYARGPRNRLSAEQVRDQALAVSGLLSAKMYGPSVMPPQPDGVWQTVYSGEKWVESEGEDKYRRAVYTYLKRTSPYPSFLSFDSGSREVCTIRRTITNTPLQALITLNDPVYIEAAYYLAKQMNVSDDVETNIRLGYEKATLSSIQKETLNVLKELYDTSLVAFENDAEASQLLLHFEANKDPKLAALTVVANAIMNLDEFLTKA